MWFLAVMLFGQPADAGDSLASMHYKTHALCMADARVRMAAIASVGQHGRYMCMYHNEPGRELARTPKRTF